MTTEITMYMIVRYVLMFIAQITNMSASQEHNLEYNHMKMHNSDSPQNHNWGLTVIGFNYVYFTTIYIYFVLDGFVNNKIVYNAVATLSAISGVIAIISNVVIREKYLPNEQYTSIFSACLVILAAGTVVLEQCLKKSESRKIVNMLNV